MNRLLRPALSAMMIGGMLLGFVLAASPASASATYPIAWTDIGIYPRSAPSMDAERIGDALSDGTPVTMVCETIGTTVDNGFAPTDIWSQLQDGTWLPQAFLNTGIDGWTPGIPRCSDPESDQPQTEIDSDSAESSWRPHCGDSEYFSEINVREWADGDFTIMATIKPHARAALSAWDATVSEWHAIQDCVSGLEGEVADSIFDQLECHQAAAATPKGWSDGRIDWATGDTYDLESWRGTFDSNWVTWISARCGNALSYEKDPADAISVGRPDDGGLDLNYGTIG